jgi:hypothetical protein
LLTFPVSVYDEKSDSIVGDFCEDELRDLAASGQVLGIGSWKRIKKVRMAGARSLIAALKATTSFVKVFAYAPPGSRGVNFMQVEAAVALALVLAHADYEWGGTDRRCRYIRPTTPPPPPPVSLGPDPRDSADFEARDSGQCGFLRYPVPFGGEGLQFPALARFGAGLGR